MRRRTSITLSPEAYGFLARIRGEILIKRQHDITLSAIVNNLIMLLREIINNKELLSFIKSKVKNEEVREFFTIIQHIGE